MDNLSTSSTPATFPIVDRICKAGGFGSQLVDGFGCAYFSSFNHTTGISVSTTRDSGFTADEFCEKLWDVLVEMRRMFDPNYHCDYKHADVFF